MSLLNKMKFWWEMRNISLQNCPKFRIEGNHWGKCIRVVDGDTFHVAFKYRNQINSFCIRLAGCDTPEMRPHGLEGKEKEIHKKLAEDAKVFVERFILNQRVQVLIDPKDNDKFGRLLARIQLSCGCDLTEILVKSKRALAYNGGEKTSEFPQPDLTFKSCLCRKTKISL